MPLNIDALRATTCWRSCAKHAVPVSTVETLLSGGTRIVLNNADDTAIIARAYKSKIIAGQR